MAKKKYICAGCNKCTEPCTVELSGDADMTKDPAKMLHCGTWVEVPAEENTNKVQLPKLTTEVFSMEECPGWARYAAVDPDGEAYWYAKKPPMDACGWCTAGADLVRQITRDDAHLHYDNDDWEHSLIERPAEEQLPKLTADVFSMAECPKWARYAAVDACGSVYWYEAKPSLCPAINCWFSNGLRTKHLCDPPGSHLSVRFDATDWEHSLIERPVVEPLPKLTHDVFDMLGCPSWARYAAVDANGLAYYYSTKPKIATDHYKASTSQCICVSPFDATDWEHSLIERPAVAPKLTQDVFSAKECPEWARYASVDENGFAYWYEMQPRLSMSSRCWFCSSLRSQMMYQPDRTSAIIFDSTDWMHSLIERQPVAPRQKLTAEVFSMKECPYWAKYAAVDANGLAYWYDAVPCRSTSGLRWNNGEQRARKICYAGEVATPLFDATDWEHSLIKRPATVPEWFKPGVLAYNNDTHSFFHVTDSTEYCEKYLEAKVRPFNAVELERKLGQSVLGIFNSRLIVTGFRPKGIASDLPEICVLGTKWITAEELLTYGSRPQGIKQYHSTEGAWIDCGLSN